jgi:hypothetical protein
VNSSIVYIIQTAEMFITKNKILCYKNKELYNTIKKEKGQRKHSKLIELIKEKNPSS